MILKIYNVYNNIKSYNAMCAGKMILSYLLYWITSDASIYFSRDLSCWSPKEFLGVKIHVQQLQKMAVEVIFWQQPLPI